MKESDLGYSYSISDIEFNQEEEIVTDLIKAKSKKKKKKKQKRGRKVATFNNLD